ncbi:MAG: hypothetical protein EOP88_17040 [Verrucomicrobiaceae bacterium]|nr:MAG: hypothetical protein EOP88_17040 [Verrucomicrobiaceae bacterium]
MSKKRSAEVRKAHKTIHFHQRLLDTAGLAGFCARLKSVDGFTLPASHDDPLKYDNRLLVSPARVGGTPEFMHGFGRYSVGESLDLQWTVAETAALDPAEGLDALVDPARPPGSCEVEISFTLQVHGLPVQFSFNHCDYDGETAVDFNINWFFGGFTRLDHVAENTIYERFELDESKFVPGNLAEARQAAVVKALGFLQDMELEGERNHLKSRRAPGRDLWEKFLPWWQEHRGMAGMEVTYTVGVLEDSRDLRFDPEEFRKLWEMHGAGKILVSWSLNRRWFSHDTRDAEAYHQWIATLADLETASGKAALYTLGHMLTDHDPSRDIRFIDGEVLCWMTPEGALIGYCDYRRKKQPRELVLSLLTDAVWVKGEPPAEVDAFLPDLGRDEISEMIPCDVPEQVKKVAALCQKWRKKA